MSQFPKSQQPPQTIIVNTPKQRVVAVLVGTAMAWCATAAAQQQEQSWPWPFQQHQKEPGVEFKERVVEVDDETREWTLMMPFRGTDTIVTDVAGNATGYRPATGGYTRETLQAKLIAVSERSACFLVAGKEDRLWVSKRTLLPPARSAVYRVELARAVELKEPGAEELHAKFSESADATAATQQGKPAGPAPELRTWTAKEGGYTVEAAYAGFKPGFVLLRKKDGETIEVPLSRLSEQDRRYAVSLARARGEMGQR